jgi:3-hydroxyanthranilate 3,4-dioxygenase
MLLPPINLNAWIEENKAALQPPVCNKQVYEAGDFIIMVVGGPNSRKDYHYDPGAEFFYQLKGDMVLRVIENGIPKDVTIHEGEIFLLPPNTHHSPQRFANTVGLVIERKRAPGEQDGFAWYCENCNAQLHQESLPVEDIVTDLPPALARFWASEEARTCKQCGHVLAPPATKALKA